MVDVGHDEITGVVAEQVVEPAARGRVGGEVGSRVHVGGAPVAVPSTRRGAKSRTAA